MNRFGIDNFDNEYKILEIKDSGKENEKKLVKNIKTNDKFYIMSCENEYVYFLENSLQYVTKIEQNNIVLENPLWKFTKLPNGKMVMLFAIFQKK